MSDRVHEPSLDLLARGLRLVAELRELPRASPEQRLHFLSAIAELVDARIGISVRFRVTPGGRPLLGDPVSIGWEDLHHQALFLGYLADPQHAPDPTLPAVARIREALYVRRREELSDDRSWYRSDHVQLLRKAAGMDHCLLGGAATRDGVTNAFSLHRGWGDRPFTERDARLIEILFREAAPLMCPTVTLPPRLRAVLECLCHGMSEKEIANQLKLSPHTVHGYVKELHVRLGAHSRGELLARALSP